MKSAFALSAFGLSVLVLSAPQTVRAQETESVVKSAPITLNTEGTTLYAALKLLFGQARADFTIVESLKTLPVTVHLKQPFRIALDSVLKATGQPITYSVSNGIYQIVPAPEPEVAPIIENELPKEEIVPKIFKPYLVRRHVNHLNGIDIAALLGGTVIKWIDSFGSGTYGFPPSFGGMSPFSGGFIGSGPTGVNPFGFGGSPFSQDLVPNVSNSGRQ